MTRYAMPLAVLALGAILLAACGDGGDGEPAASTLDPADFQARVDNPFLPLISDGTQEYEGEETDPETRETVEIRTESTVLSETDVVAGFEVTVVEVEDFEDGELVEHTLDYYAQHKDGTVYYFGERIDDYEGGQVVGHKGQWLAGEGDAQPGIFMPADPQLGVEFEQERAPGVAEDRSTVVEVDQTVTTPAGTFSGCIKTEDSDPLSGGTGFKFYCPDIGLVREEFEGGSFDLIST